MRALRNLLIVVVVLGGLFVIADRLAVNFAEGEVADRLKASGSMNTDPEVTIHGFPFLTQVVGSGLEDVEVSVKEFDATTDGKSVRIADLNAHLRGVEFSGGFSQATAKTAEGTARIGYADLLKAARPDPIDVAPGVTAKVVGLSDGGNGKIKVEIEAEVFGATLPKPLEVLSTPTVQDGEVRVKADALPSLGIKVAEDKVREITDFQQKVGGLPGGIELSKVTPAKDGVEISVEGSSVRLAG
ncbi:LmeA family phospholipid-binding protein [Streptomyces albidoflavus]